MASFAPPIPGGPGQGSQLPPGASPSAPPGGPPPGLSGLVGGSPSSTPLGPTPDQQVEAYMEQVRNLHMAIDALATQHPEAANDLNDAKNALTASMSKVAVSAASPEQSPQPQTF